jgi:hypothetical protein
MTSVVVQLFPARVAGSVLMPFNAENFPVNFIASTSTANRAPLPGCCRENISL